MIFITSLEGHTSWWPPLSPLSQDLLSSQPLSSLSSQDICSHIQYFVQQSVTDLQAYFYYSLLGWCVWCALVRGLFFSFVWILFSCSLSSLKHSPSKWTTGGKEPQMHPWGSPQQPSVGLNRHHCSHADAVLNRRHHSQVSLKSALWQSLWPFSHMKFLRLPKGKAKS